MEQHVFFTFTLIIEGATEKDLKFKMPLKSICNRNFGSVKQKGIFEHSRRVKNRKRYVKWHYLCFKTLALFASSELLLIGLCLHYIKTCCSITFLIPTLLNRVYRCSPWPKPLTLTGLHSWHFTLQTRGTQRKSKLNAGWQFIYTCKRLMHQMPWNNEEIQNAPGMGSAIYFIYITLTINHK